MSRATRLMIAVPNFSATGVTDSGRVSPLPWIVMLALGTRVCVEEKARSVRSSEAVSGSKRLKGKPAREASSFIVCGPIVEIPGGSLTGSTANSKLVLATAPSESVALTVIVAKPNWFVSGLIVTMRFDPLPLKTISDDETNSSLDELAAKSNAPGGVSTSLTENGMLIGVSSSVSASAIEEIPGKSLTGRTITEKMRLKVLFEAPLSLTVTVMVTLPLALVAGTKLRLPAFAGLLYVTVGFAIISGRLETAVTVNVWFSLGAPELIPVRLTVCCPESSSIARSGISLSVGGSFTGVTFTVNERDTILFDVPPSFTRTVIVPVPEAFCTGVKDREPVLAPLT